MGPTELPEHVTWRLNLVREALLDIMRISSDQTPLSRMKVILGLDQAIELLLSTLLPYLAVSVSRDRSISKMLSEVCALKPGLGSHTTHVERLRRLRNQVQHDGVVPSQEDVQLMIAVAEAFVRDTVREVCGNELEELSPISIIEQPEARSHLEKSQQALLDGDFGTATTEAAIAFYYGWSRFKRAQPRFRSWGEELCELLIESIGEAATSAARGISRFSQDETISEFASGFDRNIRSLNTRVALEDILEPIDLGRLGVDISDYARFQELTPEVFETLGGPQPHFHPPENYSPSQQDALFAFGLATSTLTKLQGLTPKGQP